MTPSPDLLAVLREAREFVADYLDPDSDPGLVLAQRTLDRIDSALSAHEAQGRRPISENDLRKATIAFLGSEERYMAMPHMAAYDLVAQIKRSLEAVLPPPPEPQQS